MLTLLTTLALSSPAHAQACDAKALKKALAEATPTGLPAAFEALAACDAAAAKKAAPDAFKRALPGDEGNALVVHAVAAGASDDARAWVAALQSDERSRTIAGLGDICGDGNAQVGTFLVQTQAAIGDRFWTERWYRSLAECRTPEVQEMLRNEVQSGSTDRTRFFGVVEVFSRNLGKDAIPYLRTLLTTIQDDEELTYVVNAFADAAQVGSESGQDAEATAEAVKVIVELAPQLPVRAVEQARTTLTSMGAQAEADALAAVRYAAQAGADGRLHYGLIVLEETRCKKDKSWLGIHSGELVEGGTHWPDQVAAEAPALADAGWAYPQAKKCKGTSQNTVILAPSPQTPEELAEWRAAQLKELGKRQADKVINYEESPLSL